MIDYDIEIDYYNIEAAEIDDCPDTIEDYSIMPPEWRKKNDVDSPNLR